LKKSNKDDKNEIKLNQLVKLEREEEAKENLHVDILIKAERKTSGLHLLAFRKKEGSNAARSKNKRKDVVEGGERVRKKSKSSAKFDK
jgi:hypothetical protein